MKACILVFLFIFSSYCVTVAAQDQIIAVVNNEAITQSEFDEFLGLMYMDLKSKYSDIEFDKHKDELSKTALSRLIEDRLILQEAKRENLEVRDKDVNERFDDVKSGFPSDAQFEEALIKQGLTPATLKKQLKEQLLMQEIIDKQVHSQIRVSPSEVTAYYRGYISEFTIPVSRKVESIFVQTKEKADEVSASIKEGKPFSELKEKYNKGADISLVRKGELLKELDDLIFSLKVGEVSAAFKTPDGFYLFKLIEELSSQTKKLPEVQNDIFNLLTQEKTEKKFNEWIDGLKKKAYINVK